MSTFGGSWHQMPPKATISAFHKAEIYFSHCVLSFKSAFFPGHTVQIYSLTVSTT